MRRHRTTARGVALLLTLLATATVAASASAREQPDPPKRKAQGAGSTIVFPVVGSATFGDDWGDARGQGRHAGNDIIAPRKALAVAAEAGKVKFWTTSSRAGCMLYLYGESGTTYIYIHLNNDLGKGNDNKGKCVDGVAYAPGLKTGDKVAAGEPIAFVGDSGDANGIHPHLHFEVHPKDGADVNPRPYLLKATHLVFAAMPGSTFSLAVTGKVVDLGDGAVELEATQVRLWPGSRLIKQDGLRIRLEADVNSADESVALLLAPASPLSRGKTATVFTSTGKVTFAAQTGAAGALAASRVVLRPQ